MRWAFRQRDELRGCVIRKAIPAAFCVILAVNIATAQTDPTAEVLKVEAAFTEAKIHNDVAAIERILTDECIDINQWGARRDKHAMLQLFRKFETTTLVPTKVSVRVSGEVAVIDGIMNEANSANQMKFMFMRIYVRRQGRWQLLSTAQTFAMNPQTMKPIDPDLLNQ
jgi:ketosteroid isomerase-like protein